MNVTIRVAVLIHREKPYLQCFFSVGEERRLAAKNTGANEQAEYLQMNNAIPALVSRQR